MGSARPFGRLRMLHSGLLALCVTILLHQCSALLQITLDSVRGQDSALCGAGGSPCKTLSAAAAIARRALQPVDVLLRPGTYECDPSGQGSPFNRTGQDVTVRAELPNGPRPVIDCRHRGRALLFHATGTVTLQRLEFARGNATAGGSVLAAAVGGQGVFVDDCLFRDSRAFCEVSENGTWSCDVDEPLNPSGNSGDELVGGGGAIYFNRSAGFVARSQFVNCSSRGLGGAILMAFDTNSTADLVRAGVPPGSAVFRAQRSQFVRCAAPQYGGGVHLRFLNLVQRHVIVEGCLFDACESSVGSAIQLSTHVQQRSSVIVVRDSVFRRNVAVAAATVQFFTDVPSVSFNQSMRVTGCTFEGNLALRPRGCSALQVLGMHVASSTLIEDCRFARNGGASTADVVVFAESDVMDPSVSRPTRDLNNSVVVNRCAFAGNLGVGLLIDLAENSEQAWVRDRETWSRSSYAVVSSCQFLNNLGGSALQASNGTVFLTDSLFRNNSGAQFGGAVLLDGSAELQARSTLFDRNQAVQRGDSVCSFTRNALAFANCSVRSIVPSTSTPRVTVDILAASVVSFDDESGFRCAPGSTLDLIAYAKPAGDNLHTSEFASVTCYSCDSGEYSFTEAAWQCDGRPVRSGSSGRCLACPDTGADCSMGGALLRARTGYWVSMHVEEGNASDPNSDDMAVRARLDLCPPGYCAAKPVALTDCIQPDGNPNCDGPIQCGGNRTGRLCGECMSGFSQSLLSKACVRSESCTDGAWFLPALLLLACFGVAVLVAMPAESSGLPGALIFFYQTADLLLADVSSLLGPLRALFDLRVQTAGSSAPPVCVFAGLSTPAAIALGLAVPLLAALVLLASACCYSWRRPCLRACGCRGGCDACCGGRCARCPRCCHSCCSGDSGGAGEQSRLLHGESGAGNAGAQELYPTASTASPPPFRAAFVKLILFTFSSLLKVTFALLHCVPVGGEGFYLFHSATVSCYTWWQQALLWPLLSLLLSLPLVAVAVAVLSARRSGGGGGYDTGDDADLMELRSKSRMGAKGSWQGQQGAGSGQQEQWSSALRRVAMSPFRARFQYWQAVQLLQLQLGVAAYTFAPDPMRRIVLLGALSLAALLLQTLCQPFVSQLVNGAQTALLASQVVMALVLAEAADAAWTGMPRDADFSRAADTTVALLLLLPLLLVPLGYGPQCVRAACARLRGESSSSSSADEQDDVSHGATAGSLRHRGRGASPGGGGGLLGQRKSTLAGLGESFARADQLGN